MSTAPVSAHYGSEPEADPAVLRRVLGARLRNLRRAAHITGDVAAHAIRTSRSRLSRLETGQAGFLISDVTGLLRLYGMDDVRTRAEYLDLAYRAGRSSRRPFDSDLLPRGLDSYLVLEDSASLIRCYAPGMIPGLLQTPGYAREVLAVTYPDDPAEVERHLAAYDMRWSLLDEDDPPRVWIVIEQSALRRQLGSHQVWRDQLDHLTEAVARPNICVQIMPDHAAGPAISTVPFTVFRFADADLDDVVHVHHATGAQLLDTRPDLDTYHGIWERLCVTAIKPERTGDIVTAAAAGAHL
ncbi:transcriptional regulator with XRE-family HTH domain [Nocardia transvalensis]|uniref:Transcriptional regulator with XRE-family HTH domain n=1 Tax=Nocardia transvalensis TaxID=37333 RepID=A0A7W9PAT3_9NOCA|nr:helix-turn-helix transcriptional regulator [Nocardia transvalensis]MBB5912682.1 transcriptional regulator with XRE-family HTH domain [Nocardia transvalensis]